MNKSQETQKEVDDEDYKDNIAELLALLKQELDVTQEALQKTKHLYKSIEEIAI